MGRTATKGKSRTEWPPHPPFTAAKMADTLRHILTRTDTLEKEVEQMLRRPIPRRELTSFLLRALRVNTSSTQAEWSKGTRPFSMTSSAQEDGGFVQFFSGKPSPGEVVGADIGPVYWFDSTRPESSLQVFAAKALKLDLLKENAMDSDPLFVELREEMEGIVAPTPVPLWKPTPTHPGTTLPKDWQHPNRPELKGWKWYPVVQHDVEPAHVIKLGKRCFAHVEVCQQDGCWVEGIDYRVNDGGGGYAPGRTGGEHPTAFHAELHGWERVLKSIESHAQTTSNSKEAMRLMEAVKLRIGELRILTRSKQARANAEIGAMNEAFKASFKQPAKPTAVRKEGTNKVAIAADASPETVAHPPVATGLHLQLPSTAELPPGYAKAKDLKPGMLVFAPRRKDPLIVNSVEVDGKSCSIMFEGGEPGMNVNPLQPVRFVSMWDAANVPADAAPSLETVEEAIAFVRSHAYVERCISAVLLHKPGMPDRWDNLCGTPMTEKVLMQHVAASWPADTTLDQQPFAAYGCSMLCAGYHHPELMPRIMFQGAWVNGEWYRQDDLSEMVAHVMGVQLPHHKAKAKHNGRAKRPGDVVITKDQLNKLEQVARKAKKKLGHQAGDVLPDGTMVVDPTSAILELHDAANAPVATTPATAPAPPVSAAHARVATLAELAAPFGKDRREREVVKKRFRSMYGKLTTWPAEERRAFLQFIQTLDQ